MKILHFNKIVAQPVVSPLLTEKNIQLNILRLDEMHPIISGNKWFKLKYNIKDALDNKFDTIATFGGPYSNHIVATASACKESGLKSVGIIRGEEPEYWSHTLIEAQNSGMRLIFQSRGDFKQKENIKQQFFHSGWYWVNEGGYGSLGVRGAAEIPDYIPDTDNNCYSHILCAVGTGTMMAGLIKAARPHQTIIGINVLKNRELIHDIRALLNKEEKQKDYTLINEYHFGGYAKHPPSLIHFMKVLWETHQLPTDIVYTSKMLYAVFDLVQKDFFQSGDKIIAIHSGGLQGNLSLPAGTLPF